MCQQSRNTISLIESLPYIEREFVDPTPSSIPLMELEDHPNVHFVRYSDLEHLAEVKDITIQEAASAIQKANLLPARRFVIAMEEWRPLINPSIIDEFPNVLLIKEQGPLSMPYRLCETYLGSYIGTQEPLYLNLYLEAIENESFAEWLITEAWDGFKGDLNSMKAARDKFYAAHKKAAEIANNENLSMEQRQKATNDMIAIQRSIQSFDDAIAAREKLQTDRKASQQGAIALQQKHGREADHPNSGPLTPEQQKAKVNELKAKRYDQMKNQPQPGQTQQPEQQGWWARNWAAFKNWMNNLGSSGDHKSTWFTNMINKVKSTFSGSAQAAQPANQQQAQQGQATNQPQQQTQQGQATNQPQQQAQPEKPQGTAVEQITQQAVQKGTEKVGTMVDSLKDKIDSTIGNALGFDVSDITSSLADQAKNYINNNGKKLGDKASEVAQNGADTFSKTIAEKVKNTATKSTK